MQGQNNQINEKQRAANLANMELAISQSHSKRANGENAAIAGGLMGDLDPRWKTVRELPYHRTAANMAAAGYEVKEIAAMLGRTPGTISNVLRQPHAREYLINEAKKTVQDEIKQLLEQEAIPSLQLLKAVRDNDQVRPSDRAAAANSLLDRFLGKPTQPIVTESKPAEQLTDDELKARANDVLSRFSRPEGISEPPAS